MSTFMERMKQMQERLKDDYEKHTVEEVMERHMPQHECHPFVEISGKGYYDSFKEISDWAQQHNDVMAFKSIKTRTEKYQEYHKDCNGAFYIGQAYTDGAVHQLTLDIKNASEWLRDNAHRYIVSNIGKYGIVGLHDSIYEDFHKAMEQLMYGED